MKTIKKLFIFPLLLLFTTLVAQNNDPVIIEIEDEEITKSEFKRIYLKNNSSDVLNKSTIDEYLDLFINFKLKVKEAEELGLDTVKSFVEELKGYREQLAQPYLSEDNTLEELKKEAYERLQQDVRASHILISVDENASPEDTLEAYEEVQKVLKLLQKKGDFEKLAKEYSDDPSVKENSGDLGYFTAFYMVYPFESAAYKTKKGEYSEIVRSKFGYHILKVTDKRKAVGNITVAHLLISNDPEFSKTDDPESKIKEIYAKIEDGTPFEELVGQFSDDTRSAEQGGELPSFGVGRMVPEFEEVAFSLKKDGDISEPFETPYGWHIIKRLKLETVPPYKEVESNLEQKVKKDSRSKLSEGAGLKKIKEEYGFSENKNEKNDFYELVDESYFKGNWDRSKSKGLNKTLFTIGEKDYTQADFAKYLAKTQRKRKLIDSRVLVNDKYFSFMREQLMAYKDAQLDEEYPEFKALMEEYRDGILLFNLTDEMVWSKAVNDSAGLKEYYEENKENYRWKKRYDAVIFSALNEEIAAQVKQKIKDSIPLDEIIEEINRPSQLNLKHELKKYEVGEKKIFEQIEAKKGLSKNIKENGRISFVWIKEILEPGYKKLSDARGIITSDYQQHLEGEWLKNLKEKYDYQVHEKVLNELKSELK